MKRVISVALAMLLAIVIAFAAAAEPIILIPNQSASGAAKNMPEDIPAEYNPLYIQRYNNTLYFVDQQEAVQDDYDNYIHTLYAMDASGSVKQIGESRRYRFDYAYSGEDYSHIVELTHYNGYTDMMVYEDHIYFVGTDDTAGSYTTHCPYWDTEGTGDFTSSYKGTACIYRMDLNGGNLVKLISGLGNGVAHFDIANDRIAVASCYMNNFFVYDFVDFMFYDMEGKLISKYENPEKTEEAFAYMDGVEFNVIVVGIQTDGENIYVSQGDSEGDFASSRLAVVPDMQNTMVYEAYYVPSQLADNGALVYFTSDAPDEFWDENMADTLTIRVSDSREERVLAYVPAKYAESWGLNLFVIGDMVYLMTADTMLRVSIYGGDVERLENGEFVFAADCVPDYYNPNGSTIGIIGGADGPTAIFVTGPEDENIPDEAFYFLPDSDIRKYSREELEQYDTELLGFMRNEILARYGYPFKTEKYKTYFESMPWYTRNENFEYGMLTSIEMENVETIKKIEKSR